MNLFRSDAGTPTPALVDRVSAPAAAAVALAELAAPPPTAAAAVAPPALPGPSPGEDLEPELGPEALVCHEVDLDEPDEKEKSCTAPEQLLLMMRDGEGEDRGPAGTRAEQEGDSSPGFDGSASSSSTSLLSLQDAKDRGQKRVTECNLSPAAKNRNAARNASARWEGGQERSSKDKHTFSPQRAYKWTFQLDELDSMSSSERISFLQDKLQEIRKYYMTLKSEVASIDRRRKRLKKKEREVSNTTASSGPRGPRTRP
ncbi:hypothetical protein EPR50_G00200820 [Perca flavescens]|uniref:Uncharacterized protein n=1 Tax=Perca flavescens TaxID=8167 RepID=A0A484C3C4_PERFV|nr:hypothetical protein EPR50_G00200820 [Perca flavescens]